LPEILGEISQLETDLSRQIGLLNELRRTSTRSANQYVVSVELARLYELSGRLDEARQSYEASFRLKPDEWDFESLLRAARLHLEFGAFAESIRRARLVIQGSQSASRRAAARLVIAEAYLSEGNAQSAQEELNKTERAQLLGDPAGILLAIRVADALGRTGKAEEYLQRLTLQYPDSPEAAIALGDTAQIAAFPSPLQLSRLPESDIALSLDAPEESAGSPPAAGMSSPSENDPPKSDERRDDAETSFFLQTGSFSVEENARYMREDLLKLGFEPIVRSVIRDGARYYQVLVPVVDDSREAAEELMGRIQQRGFDGFLVGGTP
jgi:tetratricopeptide (TPR) repeat protein